MYARQIESEKEELRGHEDLSYLLGQRSEVGRIGKESGKFNPNDVSHFKLKGAPKGYESHRLVSAEGGEIKAAMQITKVPPSPGYETDKRNYYVANIYTHPDARRRGHMSRLYDYAKEKFGELDWSETSPVGTAFKRSVKKEDEIPRHLRDKD